MFAAKFAGRCSVCNQEFPVGAQLAMNGTIQRADKVVKAVRHAPVCPDVAKGFEAAAASVAGDPVVTLTRWLDEAIRVRDYAANRAITKALTNAMEDAGVSYDPDEADRSWYVTATDPVIVAVGNAEHARRNEDQPALDRAIDDIYRALADAGIPPMTDATEMFWEGLVS